MNAPGHVTQRIDPVAGADASFLVAGKPSHQLVLLPGDEAGLTWKKAGQWAKAQGGDLPTRKEQALLFANAADAFKQHWYWSGEPYAGDASYAWGQNFDNGYQDDDDESAKLRARAVRRVAI